MRPMPQSVPAFSNAGASAAREVRGDRPAWQPSVITAPVRYSIFDLDRTLTRKPTYTAFLAFAAWHHAPFRLLNAPAVIACMLVYLAGGMSRRRVKELEQSLLLGPDLHRDQIEPLAWRFAERLMNTGIFADGLACIARERAEGRRIVLATAANTLYLDAIAARIGIGQVVATRSLWHQGRLVHRIDGDNCYGVAKRDMLADYLERAGVARSNAHIRFFSDHVSDRPTFDWADEPVAVNPSPKLRQLACERHWPILTWR